MSDVNPPADGGPSPAPPREFVAHALRLRGLIGLIIFGSLLGEFLGSRALDELGRGSYLLLGFWALLSLVSLLMIFRPHRVVVGPDGVELKAGITSLRTPAANVRSVCFDGSGLRVTFHDLEQVQPLLPPQRKAMEEQYAREQFHSGLLGFTLAQVDAIREALGLAPAGPDEPAGRVEGFHRALRTGTPRVYVTAALIGLNVAVFAAMLLDGVHPLSPTPLDLIDWVADFGPLTTHGQWWRLLTATFLHIGFFHLMFNMWALSAFGPLVERQVGNVGFLVLYLVAGLVGSVASLWWNPLLVSAGASGAIFGV